MDVKTKDKLWTLKFLMACTAHFLTACAFNVLMPTIPIYLSEELMIPHSKIGIVLSSYVLALLFIRPFSGYIVDVFPRKMIYLIGLFCFMAVFSGYLLATTVGLFVLFRFLHGMFWGITSVSANTIAIDIIPSSRRAEGVGYFGVTMNLAMAIAPFFAIEIYNSMGFEVLILIATIFGILAFIVAALMKVPKTVPTFHPQKQALKKPLSLDRFILVAGLPILGNQLLITFGWGTLAAYAILYGIEIGIEHSGFYFVFLAIGIMLSRVVSGKMVDRGHLHKIILAATLVVSLSFLSFAYFSTSWIFFTCAFTMGLGYGALLPALQTLYINMAPASRRGTANATYLTGFDLGIGLGMLLGARIADYFSFEVMYYVPAVLTFIGMIIYRLFSMPLYEKRKLKQ